MFDNALAILAFLGSYFFSFVVERLLIPAPSWPFKRSIASLSLHSGTFLSLWLAGYFITSSPVLTSLNSVGIFFILIASNNSKFSALKEPFIFQDFEYFTDALKHPRLYLPYLELKELAIYIIAYLFCVILTLYFENVFYQPYPDYFVHPKIMGLSAKYILLFLSIVLILFGYHKISYTDARNPAIDLYNHGIIAFLALYAKMESLDERVFSSIKDGKFQYKTGDGKPFIAACPNLIAVQSESFFDARKFYPMLQKNLLLNFDRICSKSVAFGDLVVPAWGANTVRSEFSFLSGIPSCNLGIHRFNPYRKYARLGGQTVASLLRTLGYRTICVHPYPSSFYRRNVVYPLLGFDEFVDIRAFERSSPMGSYVTDSQLTEKVVELLNQPSIQPIFIFVITMENHGPLHLESAESVDRAALLNEFVSKDCDDLVVYANHLRNADKMILELSHALSNCERAGSLCWYGDHVPIMNSVYDRLGEPSGLTNYFYWSTEKSTKTSTSRLLNIDDLAEAWIKSAGFNISGSSHLPETITRGT